MIFKPITNKKLQIDDNELNKLLISNNIPFFKPSSIKQEIINNEMTKVYCELSKVYIIKQVEINKDKILNISHENNTTNLKEFLYLYAIKSKNLFKPKGYYIENEKYFFVYKYYEHSLIDVISLYDIDFINKMKILKMLLELVKSIHVKGIISLQLSPENIKFSNNNVLKHTLGRSLNVKSDYHIDSFFIFKNHNKSIYTPPEIYLNESNNISWHSDIWSLGVLISRVFSYELKLDNNTLRHFYLSDKIPRGLYKYIDNIFIQSIAIGILKIDPYDRPNIFEIIDNYNNLIKFLRPQSDSFSSDFYIINTKEEYIRNISLI
jgi:serine/threonine protein kinase